MSTTDPKAQMKHLRTLAQRANGADAAALTWAIEQIERYEMFASQVQITAENLGVALKALPPGGFRA
jgi:hypothetical protein